MRRVFFFLMLLLLPLISAESSFLIKMEPHYYIEGQEILVYNNETPYDGISFDIIGTNKDTASRIVDMRIVSLSSYLNNKFPNNTQILISGQEKLLWKSGIVDTTKIKNNSAIFYVGVEGKNEVINQTFYTESQVSYTKGESAISINNPKESEGALKKIGDFVWDGDYKFGLVILGTILLFITFVFWKRKTVEKLNRWRDQKQYE